MMNLRIVRLAATVRLLAVGVALSPLHYAAAETLYHFVDENGVSHFSNVPADARYRPFVTGHSTSSGGGTRMLPAPAEAAPPDGVPAAEPSPEFEEMLETEPGGDEEQEEDDADDT